MSPAEYIFWLEGMNEEARQIEEATKGTGQRHGHDPNTTVREFDLTTGDEEDLQGVMDALGMSQG